MLALLTGAVILFASGLDAAAPPRPKDDTGSRKAHLTLRGAVVNKAIGPLRVSNVFRAVESDKNVHIRNLKIVGVDASNLGRDGIRIRGDAAGVQIRDFHLAMRSTPQSGRNLPIGIAIQEGRRISIADGVVTGFRMISVPGKYTNGDGIATERPVDDLSITRVRSTDNSDGGFDLKSTRVFLDGLSAERNGRNYRFWGTVQARALSSVDPRNAHVWVAKGAQVHISKLIATSRSRAPLIRLEGPAQVAVDSCVLRLPPGTKLIGGVSTGSRVRLGAGCTA